MAFVHSPKIVTGGLVLALDAGNVKSYPGSGTTWLDRSGYGNNGTLTNGPTFDSGNGGSIVFDGVDDYIGLGVNTLGSLLNGASGVTLSSWIKISNLTAERVILFVSINGSRTGATIQAFDNSLRVGGRSILSDSFQSTSYSYTQTNTWVHFTGVIDYTTSKLIIYVNGDKVQESSATFSQTTFTISTPSAQDSIGNYVGTYQYSGNIANTQVYSRTLTSQEITQNYNATKGRFGL